MITNLVYNNAFNSDEGYETLSELHPVGFLLDARDGLNSVKQKSSLSGVFDVGVDEKGVSLGTDSIMIWKP